MVDAATASGADTGQSFPRTLGHPRAAGHRTAHRPRPAGPGAATVPSGPGTRAGETPAGSVSAYPLDVPGALGAPDRSDPGGLSPVEIVLLTAPQAMSQALSGPHCGARLAPANAPQPGYPRSADARRQDGTLPHVTVLSVPRPYGALIR